MKERTTDELWTPRRQEAEDGARLRPNCDPRECSQFWIRGEPVRTARVQTHRYAAPLRAASIPWAAATPWVAAIPWGAPILRGAAIHDNPMGCGGGLQRSHGLRSGLIVDGDAKPTARLPFSAPGGHGAVLGGGDGEASATRAVVLPQHRDSRHGVRAEEVDEVRRSSRATKEGAL